MDKDASITVRIPAATKAALEKLADADQRTLSAFIAIKLGALVAQPPGAPARKPPMRISDEVLAKARMGKRPKRL